MDFRQRLEFSIQEWPGGGKRAFARSMEGKGVRGAKYRTLVNYLSGQTEPSRVWLAAAAEVLGVSEGWLASGEGSPESDRVGEKSGEKGVDIWDFFERCAGEDLTQKAHHVIVSSWWNAVMLVLGSCPDRDTSKDEDVEFVGKWVLQEALHVAGRIRGDKGTSTRRDFNLYYSLMFNAIATAAPLPGEGSAVEDLLHRLGKREDGQ